MNLGLKNSATSLTIHSTHHNYPRKGYTAGADNPEVWAARSGSQKKVRFIISHVIAVVVGRKKR